MQRVVKFDRRAWGLLRKEFKKSTDSGVFWVNFYTFVLRRAGMSSQQQKLFKDLGKKINPQAFQVTHGFENKLTNMYRKAMRQDYHWSGMNHGPQRVLPLIELDDNDILITDDYYI